MQLVEAGARFQCAMCSRDRHPQCQIWASRSVEQGYYPLRLIFLSRCRQTTRYYEGDGNVQDGIKASAQ
jgi:hypothetical protein